MSKTKWILFSAGAVVTIRQVLSLLGLLGVFGTPTSVVQPAINSKKIVKTKTPPQSVGVTTFGDLISAKAMWSQSTLFATEASDLFLQVDLEAKNVGTKARPPITTIIVLDRSGSMDGEKIEKTKLATLKAFKSLSSSDSIGLISYSNHAQVHLRPTQVQNLSPSDIRDILDGIYPAGGTNISEGVQQAINLLETSISKSVYKRILLISDGHANRGVTNAGRLGNLATKAKQKGISISSMGVGIDYNEDLMTTLSQRGGGNYYYVRNAKSINRALSQEISKAKDILAQNVTFEFSVPPGFHLEKVFGYKHRSLGNRVIVRLGDLSSAEKRKLIAKLKFTPQAKALDQRVCNLKLQYEILGENTQKSYKRELELQTSMNTKLVKASINPGVIEEVGRVTLAETRKRAALELEAGRYEHAKQQLKKALKKADKVAQRLNSPKMRKLIERTREQREILERVKPETDAAKDYIKTEKFESRALQIF